MFFNLNLHAFHTTQCSYIYFFEWIIFLWVVGGLGQPQLGIHSGEAQPCRLSDYRNLKLQKNRQTDGQTLFYFEL